MEYYDTTTENTFDLTIKPSGDITYNYTKLDIKNHQIFVGTVGNLQENEYKQYFLHNARVDGGYYWTSENDSQPIWVPPDTSICEAQPLSDASCEGYAEALANQEYNLQCSLDALYDPGCPGYTVANVIEEPVFDFSEPELTIISVELPEVEIVETEVEVEPVPEPVPEIEEQVEEIVVLEIEETTEEVVEETTEEVVEDTVEEKVEKKKSKKEKVRTIVAKKSAEMSERLAVATSLQAQIDAQNLAIALISFNQGFGAYRYSMPGGVMQSSEIPYSKKQLSDSNRGLLNGLAQYILPEKMVDAQ